MSRPRNALNRGTAVYLDGNRVMFVWPCGCTKIENVDGSPALLKAKVGAVLATERDRSGAVRKTPELVQARVTGRAT